MAAPRIAFVRLEAAGSAGLCCYGLFFLTTHREMRPTSGFPGSSLRTNSRNQTPRSLPDISRPTTWAS